MQKVLILSYFFPPANFAGSYRILAWAKYLKQNGYSPIIVTRNWEENASSYRDISKITKSEIIHIKHDSYEVYYLPYHGNLRDEIFNKYGESKYKSLRKVLSFFELLFQGINNNIIPYNNLLKFTNDFLLKNKDIKLIITSGKPFILFKFCYILSKKFNIPWIADYRDEWSTHQWQTLYSRSQKFINSIDRFFEKKWVATSSLFITVSEVGLRNIEQLTHKKGYLILNGFDDNNATQTITETDSTTFTILYNGTLYPTQNYSIFISAVKNIIDNKNLTIKIKIEFIGLGIDPSIVTSIKNSMSGYEEYYIITDRISQDELLQKQQMAQCLLMIGYNHIKGCYSSKIYDYLSSHKPILLCPSDHNVLEELIIKTRSGYISNTKDECIQILSQLIDEYTQTKTIKINLDTSFIKQFHRKNQVKQLAFLFDQTLNKDLNPHPIVPLQKIRNFLFKSAYNLQAHYILNKYNNINKNITTLCFHGISNNYNSAYPPLSPNDFEKIIKYILKHFNIIRLEEITQIKQFTKPPLVLTFDDGYKDFIENALPILQKYNLPATQSVIVDCVNTGQPIWTQRLNAIIDYISKNKHEFIYTINDFKIKYSDHKSFNHFNQGLFKYMIGLNKQNRENAIVDLENLFPECIENRIKMMNWNDIKICLNNNVEIASHSYTHDSLITIQDQQILEKEIIHSRKILMKNLNKNINTFTFPNGLYNDEIINICTNSGYTNLLSTKETFLKMPIKSNVSSILIPRISIDKFNLYENIFKIHNFHNLSLNKKWS